MMTPASEREDEAGRRYDALLAMILIAILALRLLALRLNQTDLFFDESQYWSWSLTPAFGYYSKPPLIAWIIAAATSVCGHAEWCIRAPSAILHTLTAVFIFLTARELYDARTGFWSAIAFVTLPAVSLSSGIISTDVPLLVCWSAAIYAFVRLMRGGGWIYSVALGIAIGLGLNAKYAMAYFIAVALLYLAVTPLHRPMLRDARLWTAVAIGLACLGPNIAWNAANSFATLGHTADNAKWGGPLLHPGKMLEFFGAQFGVMGPILFGALLVAAVEHVRKGLPEPDRLLLYFSVPIILVITAQALLSRAHANWAATAYVAATILVVARLLRLDGWRWLRASTVLHVVAAVLLSAGLAAAGHLTVPSANINPAARMLGWKEAAAAVRNELEQARLTQRPFRAVLTDDRAMTATLLYYMREEETPVFAWKPGRKPRDHYELKLPYVKGSPEPVLLVSLKNEASAISRHFGSVRVHKTLDVPTGARGTRTITLYALSGFSGRE